MKYMKFYENYTLLNSYGSKELTEDEFQNLLISNCKNYSKNSINKLYRGIDNSNLNSEYLYQNHRNIIRHSIENQNIHVTLMSTMEQWENFPKYNQSIIGTFSTELARMYGKLYEIIPYDNIQIGVCPSGSIWNSFGGFHNYSQIKMTNYFLNVWISNLSDMNWQQIKKAILNIDIKKRLKELESNNNIIDIKRFFNILYSYKKMNFYTIQEDKIDQSIIDSLKPQDIVEFIENIFSSKNFLSLKYDKNYNRTLEKYFKNHKATINYWTINNHLANNQVWLEGPVLLKRISDFIKNKYK